MEGIGITSTPGVPSTTLSIVEKIMEWEPIVNDKCTRCEAVDTDKKCLANCSNNQKEKESNLMTKENECPEGKVFDADKGECVAKSKETVSDMAAGVDQEKPAENPCGQGSKLLDGKCVPADNTESCGCKEQKHEVANVDEINKTLKEQKEMISELKEIINKTTEKEVSELKRMEDFNKNLYKTAKLSTSGVGINSFSKNDIGYIATEGRSALKKFGAYSFDIDLSNEWVKEHLNRNKLQEAISFSGDQSNKVAAMNDVFVLPGGKYLKSIRDLVRFYDIPNGTDQIKIFKGDIPNNGTITEGTATGASTHTITTVTLSADTVTGVAQKIKGADIEDSPFEIFDYVAQTARAEVLESEATLVFTTAAAAATPGLWLNANSGATITHTDIASMTQDHTSIAVGLQHYENQGYDTSFGAIGYYLHPKAMRELRTSSNLIRLVQEGDANITKTGRLTHLYGVELIPGNAVDTDDNTTNDVYNNVMFVKGHTFALGSKRDLTIDMRKIPNESAFDWAWTQRKNSTTFDATSFVRISSAQ
ncbi:prohead protease [Nitrososphaeria virus YSH_462411]|uniref:Prohead protease n=1 Tax=Nitrososphaeria virus YSH_462411 TaxID=3071321 RepID=A0A976UAE9_9CAUD|nr:prohead protease [Yangshan Harbor Nitrososphaeria virus]UVF62279.1 prohead protease [Nitrososphaeria virus YSH_462411]